MFCLLIKESLARLNVVVGVGTRFNVNPSSSDSKELNRLLLEKSYNFKLTCANQQVVPKQLTKLRHVNLRALN